MRTKDKKKLTRSASNRMLFGVFGGFGEYFGINANILRVVFVVLSVISHFFPGILVYILLVVIMPADPEHPSWTSLFNMLGGQTSQTSDKDQPQGRKVIHDVDEHDEK